MQSATLSWFCGKRPSKPRGRRPDPLVSVTDDLREWFDTDRTQTARQLLDQLQTKYPGDYPDGLLRTVQRRLKVWRSEIARDLVSSSNQTEHKKVASDPLRNLEAPRVAGNLLPTPEPDIPNAHPKKHMDEATA